MTPEPKETELPCCLWTSGCSDSQRCKEFGACVASSQSQQIIKDRELEFNRGVCSVLRIRCAKHFAIQQQNENEHLGAECGGCIAEERDTLRTRLAAVEKKLEVIKFRNLTNAIKQICDKCGHTTTEDGCAFCIKAAISGLFESCDIQPKRRSDGRVIS